MSRTTVSYVLNGRTDVSIPQETRDKVLRAAEELGYRPNMAARALVMGRSGFIALWMLESTSIRHQADVIHAFQQKIGKEGYEVIINRFSHNGEPRAASDWHVDGAIAYNFRYAGARPNPRLPVINVGSYTDLEGDYVYVDLKSGVVQAMHHLVAQGRRRIAYLVNEWGNQAGDDRHDAYIEVMEHYHLEPMVITTPFATMSEGRKAINETKASFDALMCFSDELALGAYRGLLDLGMRVPEDVALVGVDGIEEGAYLEVPLTTIVQPLELMCQQAWDFLKNRLENPDLAEQQLVIPAPLEIRESSRLD